MKRLKDIVAELRRGEAPLAVPVAAYCAANGITRYNLAKIIGCENPNAVSAALNQPQKNPGTIRKIKQQIGYHLAETED